MPFTFDLTNPGRRPPSSRLTRATAANLHNGPFVEVTSTEAVLDLL